MLETLDVGERDEVMSEDVSSAESIIHNPENILQGQIEIENGGEKAFTLLLPYCVQIIRCIMFLKEI